MIHIRIPRKCAAQAYCTRALTATGRRITSPWILCVLAVGASCGGAGGTGETRVTTMVSELQGCLESSRPDERALAHESFASLLRMGAERDPRPSTHCARRSRGH